MYSKGKNSWMKHLDFILLDIICLELSLFLAHQIRHGFRSIYALSEYEKMGVVLLLIDLCVVFFRDSYNQVIKRGYLKEFVAAFTHVSVVIVCALLYIYFTKQSEVFSRLVWFWTWGLAFGLTFVVRCTLKTWLRKRMTTREKSRTVLVVGTEAVIGDSIRLLKQQKYQDFEVVGAVVVDWDCTGKKIENTDVVCANKDLLQYVKDHVVDEMFVNIPALTEEHESIIDDCVRMGITVHLNLEKIINTAGSHMVEEFAGCTVLTSSIGIASYQALFVKRVMDILGGIVGMILTGILYLFIAPIMKRKSPGPIFFKQIRIGKNGRKFTMYKFRSMEINAEEEKAKLQQQNEMQGLMFKMKNDPRIVPGIGEFIRKTSLDEFPQFFNVLKGDRSLVGTRPPTVDEYERYDMHHLARMSIKPGLTGLWQVSGRNEITDFEEVVKLDTQYISEWSLNLDIKIIMKTIKTMFEKKGE